MASDATKMALKYAHGHGYRVINVSDFKFDVKLDRFRCLVDRSQWGPPV